MNADSLSAAISALLDAIRDNRGLNIIRQLAEEAATQLRTAASEGGEEPIGFRFRVCPTQLRGRPWEGAGIVAEWNKPVPAENETIEFQALYTHPPEVARDAGRYRWLVKVWSAPFPLHPKLGKVLDAFKDDDKAKIDAAIDAAINHDAAIDAALRARAVGNG